MFEDPSSYEAILEPVDEYWLKEDPSLYFLEPDTDVIDPHVE